MIRRAPLALALVLIPAPLARAQSAAPPVTLPAVVSSVTRAPQDAATLPVRVDVLGQAALRSPLALTVDDALRQSAAFSLFRRSDALNAHPTAQGVSLRGLGPSGASRTLVLLDGVPLNDPFGGWITWTKLPRWSLAGAEIVRGGGSGTWGNAALGGTVQVFTTPPTPQRPTGAASLTLGERPTVDAGLAAELPLATASGAALRLEGRAFRTEGFPGVASAQRGPIDQPAASDHQLLLGTYRHPFADGTRALTITARHFREDRNNGTPGQRNDSRETFISIALATTPPAASAAPAWSVVAYAQDQEFASTFTAVADDRASETLALDQFAVPARTAGAAATLTVTHATAATTTLGADVRAVEGETRERYLLVNGAPTRRRTAGGSQSFAGLFAAHDRPLGEAVQLSFAARLDQWRNGSGHRREVDATAGDAVLRDDTFAARDGAEFSPRLGLVGQLAPGFRARAAAYRAFRVPTLNEYHRPFRVGNVITEANPALAVESLLGGELGLDLTSADDRLTVAVTAFHHDLSDAVANVTLGTGPGQVPGVGFVPAGGTGRQRRNLPEVRVRGLELGATWRLHPTLRLTADYLLTDARVRTAPPEAPALADRRLPQVPRHTATAGLTWTPRPAWTLTLQTRFTSEAFEDDENGLPLAAATTVDAALTHRFSATLELFAAVQNLTDATVETGRNAGGLINVAPARTTRAGLRWTW